MRDVAALLFDFDGTLIDSAAFYDGVWTRWAQKMGIDPGPILAEHHGRRFADTLRVTGHGHLDLDAAGRDLYAMSHQTTEGLHLVRGVRALLDDLPRARWAIVTSSGQSLVRRWLDHFGLPHPGVLVSAEHVSAGKPAPEGYLSAARQLGVDPRQCLVFEDAPAGIAAGRAAGATVIALETTHRGRLPDNLEKIDDFQAVRVEARPDGLRVSLRA